ncbi:MAG: site-2 protease family protein [Chlamydiota bacterium]|nr:site-2 protease family protein [Chlamydiota bacterium]
MMWIALFFLSILVHEYGHALIAYYFRSSPRLFIHAVGGVTHFSPLRGWREGLVIAGGPLATLLLLVVAQIVLNQLPLEMTSSAFLRMLTYLNSIWLVVNLVPISPLDGGQLVRVILTAVFRRRGERFSYLLSMGMAILLALMAVLYGATLLTLFLGFLAYQNGKQWRQRSPLVHASHSEGSILSIEKAKSEMASQEWSRARKSLARLITQDQQGVESLVAQQMVASIDLQEKRYREVYERLKPLRPQLSPSSLFALQVAADHLQENALILSLTDELFLLSADAEVAMRGAHAASRLGDVGALIRWLQEAATLRDLPIEKLLEDRAFCEWRDHPLVKEHCGRRR